ncbi:MAG TPA: DUF523 domain-containing protein [Gammaproteobacteria bacterium]|nr:DUF523 domain-containing protein [Gammaproteobacteria bacterium]
MSVPPPATAPRLAVSACLLGEPVRYDGSDKRDAYLCEVLASRYRLLPVCPEAGVLPPDAPASHATDHAGLGVPRPPVHLAGDPAAPRAIGVEHPDLDVTAPLHGLIGAILEALDGIDGAILKARSPSCGLAVEVAGDDGRAWPGVGLFARALAERWPGLPLADETDIADPARREAFLERVETYRRRQAAP